MCILLKNNFCNTSPNAGGLYTVEKKKKKACCRQKKTGQPKKKFTVIFLVERVISSLCDAACNNICITSNRLWAENYNLLFDCAVKKEGIVYMGKIHEDWDKEEFIV